jgi:DNA polymerase
LLLSAACGLAQTAQEGSAKPQAARQAKLIDFGLALRRTGRETMLASTSTLAGNSIAGTLDYAAPEQMGKLSGVAVGPRSDVYGFARTMCFALFQTPQPLMRHWRSLPPALAELLEACLEEDPKQRPPDFAAVLQVLDRIAGVSAPASAGPSPPTSLTGGARGEVEPRRRELAVLAGQVRGCTLCSTLARSRQNAVFGAGILSPDLFFVGEAPGAEEDREGRPFVGPSGQLLLRLLGEVGVDGDRVFLTNALKCRPPGRKGEPRELNNCREHLLREIEIVQPRVIVCLGLPASQTLLNTMEAMGRLRGRVMRFRNIPVVCTYHPAYLLRNPVPQNQEAVLSDLRLALRQVRT